MMQQTDETINPYIAFTDVGMNLILVLLFFVAAVLSIGRSGWEKVRYRHPMRDFYNAVQLQMPENVRPQHVSPEARNDPPGVQRWDFSGKMLFFPNTARLTPEGYRALVQFARILSRHKDKWRRIRIEGHTIPPVQWLHDDWELSASRAAVVARIFHAEGRIPPHFLVVSGRAGQAPVDKRNPANPRNERVEIAIEFSLRNAVGQPIR
jgi:chemotaxis protein MotB